MKPLRDDFADFRRNALEGQMVDVDGTQHEIATLASHARYELHYGPGADDGLGFERTMAAISKWFDDSDLSREIYLDTETGEIMERIPDGETVPCPDCDGTGLNTIDEQCDQCSGDGSRARAFEPGRFTGHGTARALFGDLAEYLR